MIWPHHHPWRQPSCPVGTGGVGCGVPFPVNQASVCLRLLLAVAALMVSGCATVQVQTQPPDAAVDVDGEPLPPDRSFKEGLGWKDHRITVRSPGYAPKTVVLPRDRLDLRLATAALVISAGCTVMSVCAAGSVGAVLGNRRVPSSVLGAALSSLQAGPSGCLVMFPYNVFIALVVATIAPDILTVPCMGLCTLLGSWPLLGLAVPLLAPRAADVVEIKLERQSSPAAPPAQQNASPAETSHAAF